jgi:tetratricopeptide (TPR) repeat protein
MLRCFGKKDTSVSMMQNIRAYLVIFLVCIAAGSAGCGAEETPAPLNPMGLSGKYAKAAETNYALARALWGNTEICREPQQAILYLNKTIELAPDYADAYMRRGLAKSDLRDWDGAFDDITKAILLAQKPEYYAYRGLVSMRGGNSLGARKDFDRSLEINSSQHRAWNFRGGLNILLHDFPGACADFKRGCSNGDCTGLESAKKDGYCD